MDVVNVQDTQAYVATQREGQSHSPRTISLVEIVVDDASRPILVVDFDEWLFLSNSTEEFLDALKPAFVSRVVLLLLDKIRPWRFFPEVVDGVGSRDWFRVVLLIGLLPWNLLRWRKRAEQVAQYYVNLDLIDAIKQRPQSRVLVVSRGFIFIIRPIVQHLPVDIEALVGYRCLGSAVLEKLSR